MIKVADRQGYDLKDSREGSRYAEGHTPTAYERARVKTRREDASGARMTVCVPP